MNTRIIGIGSPFGPDRLGWLAADALTAAGLPHRWPRLEIRKLAQPAGLLITELEGVEQALLIDAVDTQGPAGELLRLELADLQPSAHALSTHRLGIAEALALAKALGRWPQRLVVFGIGLGCGPWPEPVSLPLAIGQQLAAAVQAQLTAPSPVQTADQTGWAGLYQL